MRRFLYEIDLTMVGLNMVDKAGLILKLTSFAVI